MEVKKGYKQTEIGVIPEDWDVLNLGKSSVLKARIGWQGLTTAEYLKSGDYYLITGTDFKEGYIDWDNCVYVEKERYIQDKNIQIKEDDILVTKDGTIGKVAFIDSVPKDTTLNSGVFVVRPINKVYNQRYLYYVLMSEHFKDFLNRLTAGSTISHLYQKDFVFFDFPKPSLKEQTAIANALSDTDAWINSLEQLLTKKHQIKQGAMQELLKPKEGWEVKKLGDYIKFQTGFPFSSEFFNTKNKGIRLVKNRDLRSDDSIFYFSGEYSNDFILKNGDLLIGMDGDFEPVLWKKGVALLNQQVGRIIEKKVISIPFLSFILIKKLKEIEDSTGSTTVKHLSHSDIENIEMQLPNSEEQTRIATILSDMDEEIAQLETKLAKAKQIKQGMMQDLLTGRIRLV